MKKAVGSKALNDPAAKRMARNIRRSGGRAATEVYRLDDDGTGKPLYFDVFSMKEWALGNLEEKLMVMDWDRAERLVTSGAIDPIHIRDHTITRKLEPIIVCRSAAGPGEDQIVDGAHRYVALAMGAKMTGVETFPVPAYVLEPDEWRQFLIPQYVATAFRFDDHY